MWLYKVSAAIHAVFAQAVKQASPADLASSARYHCRDVEVGAGGKKRRRPKLPET
jgi:hypothetical protein